MKKLLIAVLATVSAMAIAQDVNQKPVRPKPGIRAGRTLTPPGLHTNANFRIKFPEITGPYVLLLSASDKISTNVLNEAKDSIMMMLRLPVKTEVRSFDGCAVAYGEKILTEPNVAAVVIAKDDVKSPSLVSFPEKKIVVINPLAYCPDGTEQEKIKTRMLKMLQRGYCAVLGATLAPVFSVEDLDALHGGIAPSALNSVFRYSKVLGMERMTPFAVDKDGNSIKRPEPKEKTAPVVTENTPEAASAPAPEAPAAK